MNRKALVYGILPALTLIFVGAIESIGQAAPFKYNVEYVCKKKHQATERVVVRYCRRDSDQPGERTADVNNYCHVEYLDRPTNIPSIPFFSAELQSDIGAKLASCKDPATGKPPTGGGSTSGNTTGGSADTSIAKALAAKVDINILGMRFGDPLGLGTCSLFQLGSLKQNCFDLVTQIGKDFGAETTVPDDMKIVTLTSANCPSWVWNCTAYVTVHDGKLDGVALFTDGRNSATKVTRDLTTKYGKPTRIKLSHIVPDTGNEFDVNNPEWDLPGLRVRYEVIRRDEDSDRINTKEGIVRIMTETEHQRRLNKQKEPTKTKL